jgi:MFS transporter, DHA2 family, multidrug resistance protein
MMLRRDLPRKRAGLVLVTLILVAAPASLNLSVANIALPEIGKSFDSSATTLDLIAVALLVRARRLGSLFDALGDRHGRKLMRGIGPN